MFEVALLLLLLLLVVYSRGLSCSFCYRELLSLHGADILDSGKQLYALNMLILVLHEVNRNVLLVRTRLFCCPFDCDLVTVKIDS